MEINDDIQDVEISVKNNFVPKFKSHTEMYQCWYRSELLEKKLNGKQFLMICQHNIIPPHYFILDVILKTYKEWMVVMELDLINCTRLEFIMFDNHGQPSHPYCKHFTIEHNQYYSKASFGLILRNFTENNNNNNLQIDTYDKIVQGAEEFDIYYYKLRFSRHVILEEFAYDLKLSVGITNVLGSFTLKRFNYYEFPNKQTNNKKKKKKTTQMII